jgi:hypothetical protein
MTFTEAITASEHGLDTGYRAQALKFYKENYLKFDDSQRQTYSLAFGSWGFCAMAQEAYNCQTRRGTPLSDGQRVYTCGMYAAMAMARLRDLQDHLKLNREQTLVRIDEMNRWLFSHGQPNRVPSIIDSQGGVTYKTFDGVYGEMVQFVKMRDEKAMAEAEKAAKGGAR